MPKRFSYKQIKKVLLKDGFLRMGQCGSHEKLRKNSFTVILPVRHKEIPIGTFKVILKQAGLTQDDFERILGE